MIRVFKCKRSKSEVLRACKLQDGLMNVICIGVINFTSLRQVIRVIHELGAIRMVIKIKKAMFSYMWIKEQDEDMKR